MKTLKGGWEVGVRWGFWRLKVGPSCPSAGPRTCPDWVGGWWWGEEEEGERDAVVVGVAVAAVAAASAAAVAAAVVGAAAVAVAAPSPAAAPVPAVVGGCVSTWLAGSAGPVLRSASVAVPGSSASCAHGSNVPPRLVPQLLLRVVSRLPGRRSGSPPAAVAAVVPPGRVSGLLRETPVPFRLLGWSLLQRWPVVVLLVGYFCFWPCFYPCEPRFARVGALPWWTNASSLPGWG